MGDVFIHDGENTQISITKRFKYSNVLLRNMEIISKISKGSRMDQIYLPKNRIGLDTGSYVIVKPLDVEKRKKEKPYFYNIKSIEPIKLEIIYDIINIIGKSIEKYDNIIITGSFLDKGFNFNDIDVILISGEKPSKYLEKTIENKIKIKIHIILLDNKTLIKGLSTDPLYQMMLSKCIAKKRFIYNVKNKINYKLVDLHFLKSKILIDNFDILYGNEKYTLLRNIMALHLYLQNKKITKEKVDKEIKRVFDLNIKDIKQNIIEKTRFIKKYKSFYDKNFNKIMKGIKNEKQK